VAGVEASSIRGIPAITPVNAPPCSGFTWFQCPHGYGLTNETNYKDCCGAWPNYCPGEYQSCGISLSCCPNGIPYYCVTSEGSYCCPAGYAVCGAGKKCFPGGCQCTGCVGPNPCEFGISCQDCESCCSSYIKNGLCSGWQCSGGIVASKNVQTTSQCVNGNGFQKELN